MGYQYTRIVVTPLITITAADFAAGAGVVDNMVHKVIPPGQFHRGVASLRVTVADRTNGDEVYNVYLTTFTRLPSGLYCRWDVLAFPQIAADAAVLHVAPFHITGMQNPNSVTTAGPGVSAILTGTRAVTTAGAGGGIRTITAGMVYHGALGEGFSLSVTGGGTSAGPFTFELGVSLFA